MTTPTPGTLVRTPDGRDGIIRRARPGRDGTPGALITLDTPGARITVHDPPGVAPVWHPLNELTRLVPVPETALGAELAFVRRVATHHRDRLRQLADEMRDDPSFVTGAAWGLRALARVLAAADGDTDPEHLGLRAEATP